MKYSVRQDVAKCFKSSAIFEGLFSIWQTFEPTLAFLRYAIEQNNKVVNGQI